MFPTINLGIFSLPTPQLILLLGFWLASIISERNSYRYQIDSAVLEKLIWICLLAGVIGARLSYIANSPSAFQGNLISIVSINPNLLDPVGGVLISCAAGFYYLNKNQVPFWSILDALTPFFLTFTMAIDLSNFASGSSFGTATTLPWGIFLWGEFRHPVQLYYLLSEIIFLVFLLKKDHPEKSKPGYTFLFFTALLSISRILILGFQATGSVAFQGIRINHLIFWLILALSFIGLITQDHQAQREISDAE